MARKRPQLVPATATLAELTPFLPTVDNADGLSVTRELDILHDLALSAIGTQHQRAVAAVLDQIATLYLVQIRSEKTAAVTMSKQALRKVAATLLELVSKEYPNAEIGGLAATIANLIDSAVNTKHDKAALKHHLAE